MRDRPGLKQRCRWSRVTDKCSGNLANIRTIKHLSWLSEMGIGRGSKILTIIFLAIGFGSLLAEDAPAEIYTFPLPNIYTNSTEYALAINGTNVPVVEFTSQYDYAEVSAIGSPINVAVTAAGISSITSYRISPEKLGVVAVVSNNTISFSLNSPQNLIISVNNLKPFALCMDPPETDVPPSSGPGIFNVLGSPYHADNSGLNLTGAALQSAINDASAYGHAHGRGIVYVPTGVYISGNLQLANNTALYLQGGAVIRCTGNPRDYNTNSPLLGSLGNIKVPGTWLLYATNGINIKLYGRGTIDGNGYYMALSNHFGDNLLMLNCTNFTAEGITFRDAGGWGIVPAQSANVAFTNVKSFNNLSVAQDDCLDIVDSENVTVSKVFGIAGDDTISTKTYYNYPFFGTEGDLNISISDSFLWSQYIACKIGWGVGRPQSNITFSNIIVYNCQNGVGIEMYQDGNTVENVTFDSIDIENTTLGRPGSRAWGWFEARTSRGLVTNVSVRDVVVRQTGTNGFFGGDTNSATFAGVTFNQIYMPDETRPASTLGEMDFFKLGSYSHLRIVPVSPPEP
jgi:Glycosyl hydrolases family 28